MSLGRINNRTYDKVSTLTQEDIKLVVCPTMNGCDGCVFYNGERSPKLHPCTKPDDVSSCMTGKGRVPSYGIYLMKDDERETVS